MKSYQIDAKTHEATFENDQIITSECFCVNNSPSLSLHFLREKLFRKEMAGDMNDKS